MYLCFFFFFEKSTLKLRNTVKSAALFGVGYGRLPVVKSRFRAAEQSFLSGSFFAIPFGTSGRTLTRDRFEKVGWCSTQLSIYRWKNKRSITSISSNRKSVSTIIHCSRHRYWLLFLRLMGVLCTLNGQIIENWGNNNEAVNGDTDLSPI